MMIMKRRGQYAGGGSHAESLIPLILIVILAIFIAGKLGWMDLSSIPLVGSLFPKPNIKVLVVGHASPAMETLLKSEDYRLAGIMYAGSFPQEYIVPGVLKNFDIIIIQGSQVCDRPARKEITDKTKSGGKLMVVGDACTRVTDDPNAAGWDVGIGTLGDVIPVEYGGVMFHEKTGRTQLFADGKFRIVAPDHPMFNGITNYGFYGTLTSVRPTSTSDVLAYVDTYGGKITAPATFAIVESKGFLAGKTLYFAFDPANMDISSRNMFLNALLYVRGAKG
jgi:hypothetical protein